MSVPCYIVTVLIQDVKPNNKATWGVGTNNKIITRLRTFVQEDRTAAEVRHVLVLRATLRIITTWLRELLHSATCRYADAFAYPGGVESIRTPRLGR